MEPGAQLRTEGGKTERGKSCCTAAVDGILRPALLRVVWGTRAFCTTNRDKGTRGGLSAAREARYQVRRLLCAVAAIGERFILLLVPRFIW